MSTVPPSPYRRLPLPPGHEVSENGDPPKVSSAVPLPPPLQRVAYAAAGVLESACTFLDNHTPAWPWLMGWLRCPNGWLARAAFWLDGTTREKRVNSPKPYLCGCPSDDPRPCPLHDGAS